MMLTLENKKKYDNQISLVNKNTQILDIVQNQDFNRNIQVKKDFTYKIIVQAQSQFDININFLSNQIDVDMQIVLLSKNEQKIRWKIQVNMDKSDTNINLQIIWLAGKSGDIQISADINVPEWLHNVNGNMMQNIVYLDKNAKVEIIPGLHINSNDVDIKHGAKLERLPEDRKFYMQAKWLTQEMIKNMVVNGYIKKIFANTKQEYDQFVQYIL